jgi:circadian clock protein KaiC
MARAPRRTLTSRKRSGDLGLPKAPTGIQGLDEITEGGLPRGRPTLVCGSAGCGKTLLAVEFLVRGATLYDEPGVFMAFEESAEELTQNVRSLGFDLDALAAEKKISVDFVRVERGEIEETGDYDLEGLFVRLGHAIDSIGAKRVVLDTIETLFSGLSNVSILRAELRRLFRWLKTKGVTAVVTGERGEKQLTRQGIEEYVSDCVILLDHRVMDDVSTRRLRVVKYRGTAHGTNEYPFLIDKDGITVLPITSLRLEHTASAERVSSGVERLDAMLGGQGFFRGSTVLVSGTAGSGKSSLAAHVADAACERGECCLYFAFEESPGQIIRNMRSIGLDLAQWVDQGLLHFHAIRSSIHGLEMHLSSFYKLIGELKPGVVIIDPVGSLTHAGSRKDAAAMLTRLIDFLKVQNITAFLTSLISGAQALETTDSDVSSLVDTWIFLRDLELGGERKRAMYVLKSRGMAHSNQIREFLLTDHGIELVDVYLGPEGVLTGSARQSQEARERTADEARGNQVAARRRARERKRDALDARIAAMRKQFDIEEKEAEQLAAQDSIEERVLAADRTAMAASRRADPSAQAKAAPAKRRAQ